jgi:hypothetical protein
MRCTRLLMTLPLIVLFTGNCTKQDDETAIRDILELSWYVGDGALQNYDDSTHIPSSAVSPLLVADTIPYVRWARWIERPVVREYDIVVVGDSADVTIRAFLDGLPPEYGFFVNNDPMGPVYQRTIGDNLIRKVKLYRTDDSRWRISSLTVADVYTDGTAYPVTINEIIATVESRQYEFRVDNANTYFEKHELPIFYPNDTVEVTVTCTALDDSTWAFLHHGAGHRPGLGYHIRQPFFRENTITFTRTWVIASDSIVVLPAVRHSAVDVLGWQTLFGSGDATYYSRAWCLPYIVLQPGQDIPEDEE